MAVKKAGGNSSGGSLLKRRKQSPDERMSDLDIELPTQKSKPATKIEAYNWLIYGPKGIGKTSLGARFIDSLTCQFEPGGKALETYQIACPEWIHFKKTIDLLKEDSSQFQTLVLDTAALAYERCMQYACEKAGIEHPGDEGYGKGWARVREEFSSVVNYGMSLGLGLIAIAHDMDREIETKSGRKFHKMSPQLSGQAEGFFSGPIDIVGYYHYDGEARFLQIRGDEYVEAKCRLENNFIALDGKPVYKIPMGDSADEAYENIVKAFNNQQEHSYAPEDVKIRKVATPSSGSARAARKRR